jgi:hypothetical protein
LLFLSSSNVFADVAQNIEVDRPFARAAIIQQRNSAAFMQITNRGEDSQIVFAKSPVADVVELHTHINDNGVMRMRKIDRINLPSKKPVSLKPGGLHVMLLGLNRDLKPGDEIEVTLGFADGSVKALKVPVQVVSMGHKKVHDMNMGKPEKMAH